MNIASRLPDRLAAAFDQVGNTPIMDVGDLLAAGRRVFVKLEGANPTGSVKDRACAQILEDAELNGVLGDRELLEASSGNMACSVAYFGALMRRQVTVVVGAKLTREKEAFLRYFGARLVRHGTYTSEGRAYCADLVRREPDRFFFLDQLGNPSAALAHTRTTGPEILRDCPGVRYVVVSIGSGATALGLARFFAASEAAVRLIGSEAAPGTLLPGTGAFSDGEPRSTFVRTLDEGQLLWRRIAVTRQEAAAGARRVAEAGAFCGLQTGGLLVAARRALGDAPDDGDVLLVAGDTGWKNLDALMQR